MGLNGSIVSTFIDNIKIMIPKKNSFIKKVKAELTFEFQMANIGFINFYLNLRVDHNKKEKTIKFT